MNTPHPPPHLPPHLPPQQSPHPSPDVYTLYYHPDSANLIVRMVLEEMQQPYRAELVERAAGANRSPEFMALNPQGLLPVLVDPDQDEPVFETAAILLILADKHHTLAPTEASARGRFLKWLFFLSNTLHADLRAVFYSERYVSDFGHEASLRKAMQLRILKHCELLEAEFKRHGGPWLLGNTLSVCDFYLATCLRWAQLYPRGNAMAASCFTSLQQLWAMLEALQSRPSVLRSCEQEQLQGDLRRVFTQPSLTQ